LQGDERKIEARLLVHESVSGVDLARNVEPLMPAGREVGPPLGQRRKIGLGVDTRPEQNRRRRVGGIRHELRGGGVSRERKGNTVAIVPLSGSALKRNLVRTKVVGRKLTMDSPPRAQKQIKNGHRDSSGETQAWKSTS